jgi:hypothetical protein
MQMSEREQVSKENNQVMEVAVETYLGRHEPSLR